MNTIRHGLLVTLAALIALLAVACEKPGTPAATSPSAPGPAAYPSPVGPAPVYPATPTTPIVQANPFTPVNPEVAPVLPIAPPTPNAIAIQTPLVPVSPTTPVPQTVLTDAQQAHLQSAQIAIDSIKSLMTAQDFDSAQRLAATSAKEYADTPLAPQFPQLQQQAQAAAAARAAAPNRQAQFAAFRDAGIAAMDKGDYPAAVTQFQSALQIQDDPQVRGMLQHAANFTGKPRIAVAEFAVIGDVGIPSAGKAVPELLLGRFDPQRFQLVDHAWLDSVLAQQNLTLEQVSQMPELLRVRRVDAIRYLVTGSISRVGALTISARLIDISSGEIVQTADIVAVNPAGLQNCLGELVAILQMTNEQKAAYLAYRQQQTDALVSVDPAAMAQAEAQRQAALEAQRQQNIAAQQAAFAQAQHERDALVARDDIKALFAQGNFVEAIRYIRWARARFNDTSVAQELAQMEPYAQIQYQQQVAQQANAAQWAQIQAARAAQHQRFVQYRDQGMTALAAGDLLNAMALLQSALGEEDSPDVRITLDIIVRRMSRPGIAVIDFSIQGDVGMDPRQAPRWLSSLLLSRFAGDDSPYRVVDRIELQTSLARVGLSIADVQRDPANPRLRLLRDQIRFIIVGTASQGSIRLTTAMVDLRAGRTFQTADFVAQDIRALPDAIAGTALVLQMTDQQKVAYLAQMEYTSWMSRGDVAASSGQWDVAVDAYAHALRVFNTPDAQDRLANASAQADALRRARIAYDAAMAAAVDAMRRNDWDRAFAAYRDAFSIMPTPQAKAGMDDARTRIIAASRDRHALYLTWYTSGDDCMQRGDYDQALQWYQQASTIEVTIEINTAVSRAQTAISDRQRAKQRNYEDAMKAGSDAIKDGNWGRAIDAYTKAAGIMDTQAAANGLAAARRGQAQHDSNTAIFEQYLADATAARQANDWDKALDLHKRAAVLRNTPLVQNEIQRDKDMLERLQRQNAKKIYDDAMASAAAHAQAGQWQEALDDYRTAYKADKTKQASDGISQSTKMLNDVAYNKKQYDKAMADAASAAAGAKWNQALAEYQHAAAIDPTAEAKAGIARAQQQLAAGAAAEKQQKYNGFLTQADAAAKAGDYKKALGLYNQAAGVDNTPQVQTAIASLQKQIADAQAAADKKKDYDAQMAAADTAAKNNNWQRAYDAYNKAALIDNTAAAQAGIASAKAKLDAAVANTQAAATQAAAAAERKRQYDTLMADAQASGRAGDWQKAIDSYTRAQQIDNTPDVRTALNNARQQLTAATAAAAVADRKKQYDALMADAQAAGKSGDWQKAIDTYQKAQAITDTAEVRTAIASARQQIANAAAATQNAEKKRQYDTLIADAQAAGRAGDWQKAIDSYTRAQQVDNTQEVRTALTNARQQLANAAAATQNAEKKRQYDALMADAAAAAKAGDLQKALDTYNKAQAIDDTPAVRTAIANARRDINAAAAATQAAAAAEKKKQYDAAMTAAETAAKAGNWQLAIDNYQKAQQVDNTQEVRTALNNARQQLASAAAATQAAANAEKKKQYDAFMGAAQAAGRSGDWQSAVDNYTKAQQVDNTQEVRTALNNARQQITAASQAAQKKQRYDGFMTAAETAAKAGDWDKALDNYNKAQDIDNTPEVRAAIASAKKQQADAQAAQQGAAAKKREYNTNMTDGNAAARNNNWQKAVDAYTKAQAIDNTPEVQTALASAKQKLADAQAAQGAAADKKKQYDQAIADGDAAGKANDWQKALEDYTKAQGIDDTGAVKTKITNAKQKLYSKLMDDGDAAGKANDWQKALDAYTKAQAVNDTNAVKTAIANAKKKLGQ